MHVEYFNKIVVNIPYTNFLCLVTDVTLNCDNHIDQLIPVLNSACYAIRFVTAMLSRKAFRMLHSPYVYVFIQWLRCCATNRKVAGSIPDGVIGIFH